MVPKEHGGGIAVYLLTGGGACCSCLPWSLASGTSFALKILQENLVRLKPQTGLCLSGTAYQPPGVLSMGIRMQLYKNDETEAAEWACFV